MFGVPEFHYVAGTDANVERVTHEAFRGGLNAILDRCESLAQKS